MKRRAGLKPRAALFVFAAPVLLVCSHAVAADVNPQSYLDNVKYLASPELKGRATGSPELEKAAQYIAGKFQSFGLKPVSGKSYLQPFTVTTNAHLGSGNSLTIEENGQKSELKPATDYVAYSFSSSGKFSAPVVFAGYGITAADYHYDDYEGLDARGKIVLILRHEPQEFDEHSVFEGKELTQHSAFAMKAANAKMHGARGVILINDVYAHPESSDQLGKFGEVTGPTDSGVFFVQVKEADAESWLRAEGHDLKEIVTGIDKDLKPRSFALTKLTVDMSVDIQHDQRTVHNVAAYLPGKTSEYIIIGAHYDHLGLGDEHSLAPSQMGTIHPGADDNASGSSGVIELARWFAHQPKPKRGILFMTFAGEELGLLGSGYYTAHPLLPLQDAVAMLNMDMIGRIRAGKVYVNATGTGSTFDALIKAVQPPPSLHIDLSENIGYGGSDHLSFSNKSVPVLFFFSGLHGDYHKPSDTADKIDAPDAATLLDYIAELATHLQAAADRPKFQRVAEKQPSIETRGHDAGGAPSGGGSGYGPNFGSIPDFDEPPKGVRFADVRDGTPAAKAGLKAGDILIEFDGKEIGNLYDFTYALRAHKPGDLVLVKVLRGSQTIETKVLLTERR
ncbi:MAG TPA: M28 family peptidase [Bryobacteraceae bacterium]|nr:M28 family peptidase [Bryobacteraceae bacterium]